MTKPKIRTLKIYGWVKGKTTTTRQPVKQRYWKTRKDGRKQRYWKTKKGQYKTVKKTEYNYKEIYVKAKNYKYLKEQIKETIEKYEWKEKPEIES